MERYNWKEAFGDAPESFQNRVEATLQQLPERRGITMSKRKISMRKKFVIALAATLVFGTTVLAAGKIVSITSSTNLITDRYAKLPTKEQLQEDLGFPLVLPEQYTNGYAYEAAYSGSSEGTDEQGNKVDASREITADYKRGEDTVSLLVSEKFMGESTGEVTGEYKGIQIQYSKDHYKFVPADYELAEEDKALEASGDLVISYGSDKVEEQQIEQVNWVDEGHVYTLIDLKSKVTKGELLTMAQETIDANK